MGYFKNHISQSLMSQNTYMHILHIKMLLSIIYQKNAALQNIKRVLELCKSLYHTLNSFDVSASSSSGIGVSGASFSFAYLIGWDALSLPD